jgi:predicted amidohydrolase
MSRYEEERAVAEIQHHAASLALEKPRPQVILFPELAVPIGFLPRLRRIAAQTNSIVVAGMDFHVVPGSSPKQAMNRAAVIVPDGWGVRERSRRTTLRYVGKTYPAWREENHLNEMGYQFRSAPEVWVFDAGRYGRFAVAICYDFLDLERVAMYRLRVQSLFILAYNNDLASFDHAAEAMARMIYCNVVICNTGHYGGSVVVSPYHKHEKRILYRHLGARLSTSQAIDLPIASLVQAQSGGAKGDFKSLPPGAQPNRELLATEEALTLF